MFKIPESQSQKGVPGTAKIHFLSKLLASSTGRSGRALRAHQNALGQKTDYLVEHRAVRSDGSVRYLQAIGHPP